MDAYETEQQQVEAIKAWWKKNYPFALGGLLVVLGSVWGSQYYQQYNKDMRDDAANQYSEVLQAIQHNQIDIIKGRSELLKQHHADSPYTIAADFIEVKILSDEKKYDQAIEKLTQIEFKAKDDTLKTIASMRKIRLMAEKGENDQALSQINNLQAQLGEKSQFHAMLSEIKGDILAKLGNSKEANQAYEKAMGGLLLAGENVELIRIKKNDLGVQSEITAP